jgi:hypothetical protein
MEYLSNQHIKVFLTTIVKNVLFLIILTNFSCNKMKEQEFKVFGDESLLKDCKVNICKIYNNKTIIETIFYNGKKGLSTPDNNALYEIYFSYKDSLINKKRIENVFYGANDQINHFYINENNGMVSILFVGREAEIKSKQGFNIILIPVKDYIKQNKIENEEFISKEKKLFCNHY